MGSVLHNFRQKKFPGSFQAFFMVNIIWGDMKALKIVLWVVAEVFTAVGRDFDI